MYSDWFIAITFGNFFKTHPRCNGSLFPDWVELPQNWILSIPIAYKIDVGGDIRTTTENIIVTCQNNNISLTGGYSAGGKAVYSWTARGYYYTSNSYFSIGQPTISCNGQTPKDFNISIRINSQIYDYSDWEGYGGGLQQIKVMQRIKMFLCIAEVE